jgi:hypothetical protein
MNGQSEERSAYLSEKRAEEKAVHLHEGCDEGCTHWAHDEEDYDENCEGNYEDEYNGELEYSEEY